MLGFLSAVLNVLKSIGYAALRTAAVPFRVLARILSGEGG
jgi:hypothetical protein